MIKRKNWLLKLKSETSYTLPKVWVLVGVLERVQ